VVPQVVVQRPQAVVLVVVDPVVLVACLVGAAWVPVVRSFQVARS
jgi:hypothetical protein